MTHQDDMANYDRAVADLKRALLDAVKPYAYPVLKRLNRFAIWLGL